MDGRPEAKAIHPLPLEMFHGPGICLDVSHVEAGDFIRADALRQAAQTAALAVPRGGVVLVCTGHYGRTFPRPPYNEKHPGLDREAMEWLAERGALNVGIDCPAIDVEPHKGDEWKPAHAVCRERGVLNTENLGDLSPVVGKAFYYMGLPIRIRGGTAAPVRAVAIFDAEDVIRHAGR
jgi:kynurenine formamidase